MDIFSETVIVPLKSHTIATLEALKHHILWILLENSALNPSPKNQSTGFKGNQKSWAKFQLKLHSNIFTH